MTALRQPTFADTLSQAIRGRGLSLDRIRARLEAAGVPVSNATLSYWQSGRSLPTRSRSLRSLVELESILELEPGTLLELLRTDDGHARYQLFAWQNVMPAADVAEPIMNDMGMEDARRLSRVTVHDLTEVDAHGAERSHRTRQVLRAERTGVQTFPLIVQQDITEHTEPQIEALFGCRVGQVVQAPEQQLTVAEMVLPRPLRRGELVTTEHLVTLNHATTPSFRMARATPDPAREIILGVRFHPDALPTSIYAFAQPALHGPDTAETEAVRVPLLDGQAQSVRTDVQPGVYGLRWSWD